MFFNRLNCDINNKKKPYVSSSIINVTVQVFCHKGTKTPRLLNIIVLLFAMHSFLSDKSVKLIYFISFVPLCLSG